MGRRIVQLDALRGIAAMTVVLSHWRHVFFSDHMSILIRQSLLTDPQVYLQIASRIFVNGVGAVIVFFVLSGFVLAVSLEAPDETYSRFVVKRIARIYLPFAAAIGLAAFLATSVPFNQLPLSDWFDSMWSSPPTAGLVISHLLMLGTEKYQVLDPPMWSLVHEMRISLIFPLLYLLTCRNAKLAVGLSFLLSLAFGIMTRKAGLLAQSWYESGHVIFLFVSGAALAIHRQLLSEWIQKLGRGQRLLALLGCLFLVILPAVGRLWMYYPIGLGACGLVALCYADKGLEGFLRLPVFQFLGRISYSLYLIHVPLLIVTVRLLAGYLPNWALSVVGIAAALAMATVFWAVVERPSQRLGRLLVAGHAPARSKFRR